MTKTHTTITVDSLVLEEARLNNINISKTTENALESKLAIIKGNSKGIDKQLLLHQLDSARNKANKINAEVTQLQQQLREVEELEFKKEEERLKLEQDEAKKSITCINCGDIIPDKLKKHNFPAGVVCNGCFLSSDKEDYKKWNKKS